MDDQLRNETRIAVARIDALLEKTGRLLDQIAAGESLPASAGIQRDEMLGLDSYLKALAPRLYGGPVAERVWEPPGGKALIRAAGSTDPAAVLNAHRSALSESRAFFNSFLDPQARRPDAPTAAHAGEKPTLVDRWTRAAQNNPLLAVVIFICVVAGGIGVALEGAKLIGEVGEAAYAKLPLDTHVPKSFIVDYLGSDDPGPRYWTQQRPGEWVERHPDPNGSSEFRQKSRDKINECHGTIVARIKEYGAEVFIPDIGCGWMQALSRMPGTTTWNSLGRMHDVH